jgi:hypothetical protein
MEKYNGWTNYATWRVNLEMFDGCDPYDLNHDSSVDAYHLGLTLKEIAEETISSGCVDVSPNLAFDYAMAFLSDVNWTEIARHIIENYAERAA